MFRLKLTLLYFFTIVLVVAVMWVVIDQNRDSFVQEQLYPAIQSASTSFDALSRQRISTLKETARSLMESDLPLYLGLLSANREEMRNLLTRTRQEFPRRKQVRPDRIVDFVYEQSKEMLSEWTSTLDRQSTKVLNIKGGYASFVRDYVLATCLAEQDPWSVCYFKLTWLPLTQIIFPVQRSELGRSFPELFVLVDEDNKSRLIFDNLHASAEKLQAKPSGEKNFTQALDDALYQAGTRYKGHIMDNFDQIAPVLRKLDEPGQPEMLSSFLTLNGDKAYVVVAARIKDKEGKKLGTLIVGYEVGTGTAWADTAGVLGIRTVLQQCLEHHLSPDDSVDFNEKRCEYEMSKQENGVTYLYRNRKGQCMRAGSSLPAETANSLSNEAKDLGPEATLVLDSLLTKIVDVPVDFIPGSEALKAALTVDVEASVAPFSTMKFMVILLGILVFLLGLVVVQLLLRSFAKPFEEIDAGIHEIIGGNFDYSFPFHFRDELPRSMAQSLTIMKAVLLGLPLPEDMERDDSWAANLRVEGEPQLDEDTGELSGPVELEEVKASDLKESATEYYRRLFKEYVSAKEKLGEDVSKITYIKFVEKIAKTEKALREKFECKQVQFRVETKDRQVVLLPIKVVDG